MGITSRREYMPGNRSKELLCVKVGPSKCLVCRTLYDVHKHAVYTDADTDTVSVDESCYFGYLSMPTRTCLVNNYVVSLFNV